MILYAWGQILLALTKRKVQGNSVGFGYIILLTAACEWNQKQIHKTEAKYNMNEWFLEWLLDSSEGEKQTVESVKYCKN